MPVFCYINNELSGSFSTFTSCSVYHRLMIKKYFLFIILLLLTVTLSAQKVGLVLSGGGARGITHIGVIKALEENNIPIDYITGTSMGAIVGSMYAMGHTPDEIIAILKSDDFKRWSTGELDPQYVYYYRNADPKPGFAELRFDLKQLDSLKTKTSFLPTNIVSPRQMNYAFIELFSRANAVAGGDFDKLFVPFRCVASDIYNKEAVVFSKGNLGDAVRASMTFPFMFKPIKIDGRLLFDGGIFNNFPVDVMREQFNPGFILGSSVSNNPPKPEEHDVVRQIENMIVNRSDYSILEDEGMLLDFNLENVNTFDFTKVDELVKVGYDEVIKLLPEIKARVKREVTPEEVLLRRTKFCGRFPELKFRNLKVVGVDSLQKNYVENTFHRENKVFDANEFKVGYFKLISDDKISEVMPRAIYNDSTGLFDLRLRVKTQDQLKIMIGGNVSSSTSNEAYFGLTYQNLKDYAQTAYIDAQFGRVYNGLGLGSRIDVPTNKDWYLKLAFILHRFDYFEGSRMFYDDDRTSYFNQFEMYSKFSVGFPLTMKGRMEFGIGYGGLTDSYKLNQLSANTGMDESHYYLGNIFGKLETYSLNSLMYPTKGHNYTANLQLVGGEEVYKSYNAPDLYDAKNKDFWVQFRAKFDKYYKMSPAFTLGTFAELSASSRKLLNNYTATIIQAPAFRPTPHSKATFNPAFSANQFGVIGLKPIYRINDQFHFRTEAYWFLPYQSIYKTRDNMAAYSTPFSSSEFLVESTLVFDFKFASAGLFANHYSAGISQWNFGVNIGFLLFNNKFLE